MLCHQATIIQHSYYSLSLHSYKALKYIIVTERKNALTIDETYLIEIMELVSGIFLSERVVTHNGTKLPLTEIGRAFEYLFNIKLGDYHQKYMDVIKRKPAKLTEFLNELATFIRKEHENKGYR